MTKTFIEYFGCPEFYANFYLIKELSVDEGFFRFGPDIICYGQSSSLFRSKNIEHTIYDVFKETVIDEPAFFLPFNLTQVIDNLRYERYINSFNLNHKKVDSKTLIKNGYYLLRPLIPGYLRKYLQKYYLRNWDKIPFPRWPVDYSVEQIFEKILILSLKSHHVDKIPFIWFWPYGHQGCIMMTHDVETSSGQEFCSNLIDLDESFGIKSSFQIVPEKRYQVTTGFLNSIRERGFEVNIHGLYHDGHLFSNHQEFLQRVQRINQIASEYGAKGFRSPILHRNIEWYNLLKFSYDMSIPNVGHLEAQRGGCCTVMPYFIGNILELPLTTIQDYFLFMMINNNFLNFWKKQIELILEKHGLISLLIHPDYIISKKYYSIYQSLLEYLTQIRETRNLWIALPKEIDLWWRQRSQMKLVNHDGKWKIEGPGKERARVAYAKIIGNEIAYEIEEIGSFKYFSKSSALTQF
jgi:hypothetical protein